MIHRLRYMLLQWNSDYVHCKWDGGRYAISPKTEEDFTVVESISGNQLDIHQIRGR